MPVIDDEKLKQIADALEVTIEQLKYGNLRKEATINIFNKEVGIVGDNTEQNNHYNYAEKMEVLFREIMELKVENALLKQKEELTKDK